MSGDLPFRGIWLPLPSPGAGFSVSTFADASAALEEISRSKPDLILTDWLMPGMNGLEFCRILSQTPEIKGIPVIMISRPLF